MRIRHSGGGRRRGAPATLRATKGMRGLGQKTSPIGEKRRREKSCIFFIFYGVIYYPLYVINLYPTIHMLYFGCFLWLFFLSIFMKNM